MPRLAPPRPASPRLAPHCPALPRLAPPRPTGLAGLGWAWLGLAGLSWAWLFSLSRPLSLCVSASFSFLAVLSRHPSPPLTSLLSASFSLPPRPASSIRLSFSVLFLSLCFSIYVGYSAVNEDTSMFFFLIFQAGPHKSH